MKEPRLRYHLEAKGDRSEKELLMASVSYGYSKRMPNGKVRNVPFKISLGCNVLPKHFGKPKSFIYDQNIFKKHASKYGLARTKMSQLEGAVNKLANNYSINGVNPEPQQFKEAVKQEMGITKVVDEVEVGMVEALRLWVEYLESIEGSTKKDAIKEPSIKGYRTVLLHMEDYEIVTGRQLMFNEFDLSTYWNLWEISDEIYRGVLTVDNPSYKKKRLTNPLGYSSSSIQKYQKKLLAFLRANSENYNIQLNLNDKKLVLGSSKARKSTRITEEEVSAILERDFSHDKNLQMAKDYVVIGTLTGLRYDDVVRAKNGMLGYYDEGRNQFSYLHTKIGKVGDEEVIIPLMKPVLDIIKRNNGEWPSFFNNSKINELLKDLYLEMGFDSEEELITVTYKNGTEKESKLKCDIISTHDARRGFISNLDRHKLPQERVMNITHPVKVSSNNMHDVYNKSTLIEKASDFVEEIRKINSKVYYL